MDQQRYAKDYLPQWDGEPAGLQRWKEAVKIFRLRNDLTKSKSYAAELIDGLSGAARIAAMQMEESFLLPIPEEAYLRDGQEWAKANTKGSDNLTSSLEAQFTASKPTVLGERLVNFFQTKKRIGENAV